MKGMTVCVGMGIERGVVVLVDEIGMVTVRERDCLSWCNRVCGVRSTGVCNGNLMHFGLV